MIDLFMPRPRLATLANSDVEAAAPVAEAERASAQSGLANIAKVGTLRANLPQAVALPDLVDALMEPRPDSDLCEQEPYLCAGPA
jgi:hypothetical protein